MNKQIGATILCVGLLGGCATTPTVQQEAVTASGIRLATIAYVTRGKTVAEQSRRAEDVMRMAGLVRNYVSEQGGAVVNLDAAAAIVNERIMTSSLSPGDRVLAQAIVTEAVFLASDQAGAGNVGADNAALLLKVVTQIERAAKVFVTME